ncbi:MAG: CheR family methyltransferase, partial [Planctomycetota bacterium]|nr:CheR family methyltransferase [Planctomycetota bacterium]
DLLKSWKVRIVATDISNVVLDRGREGVYSELEIVRGLPTPLLTKYFNPFQGNWSISQSCRHFIEFRQLNLNDTWPIMMSYDIVFLRNVLLYFDTKTRGEVLEKMARAIRPDGALFLGGAETMLGLNTGYERLTGNGCSYYKPKRS